MKDDSTESDDTLAIVELLEKMKIKEFSRYIEEEIRDNGFEQTPLEPYPTCNLKKMIIF